jgi:predicted  nucleic acid-binding Zn-ribbon protein
MTMAKLVDHPWDILGPPQPLGDAPSARVQSLIDRIKTLKAQGEGKQDEAEGLKEEASTLERESEDLFEEAQELVEELREEEGGEEYADEFDDA